MVIMAGMLLGVEIARKRRLRQCSISGLESNHPGTNSMPRNNLSKELHGWTLASIAREAKERLDEKFKSPRALVIKKITPGLEFQGSTTMLVLSTPVRSYLIQVLKLKGAI